MIYFFDRDVFNIELDDYESMTIEQLSRHFLDNNEEYIDSVILIWNRGKYIGMLTYSLLTEGGKTVWREYMVLEGDFWNRAKKYLREQRIKEMILFNKNMEPITFFCETTDNKISPIETRLNGLESLGNKIPVCLWEIYKNKKGICLCELNELTWRVYHLLKNLDYFVDVRGELWKEFGIEEIDYREKYPQTKMIYIYQDGETRYYDENRNIQSSNFIIEWEKIVYKALINEQIDRLTRAKVPVCRVLFPNVIPKNNLNVSELLNLLTGININTIATDEALRERQKDFLGEAAYAYIEKKKSQDGNVDIFADTEERIPVIHRKIVCDKLSGVCEKKRIYMIGPCIAQSIFSLDQYSLTTEFQKMVQGYGYEVVRVLCPRFYPQLLGEIECLPIKSGDVVIFLYQKMFFDSKAKAYDIDLMDLYKAPREKTWFKDNNSMHVNCEANKAIAKEIYEKCEWYGILNNKNERKIYLQKGEILSDELKTQVFTQLESIGDKSKEFARDVGAIVMNCNPFTKGHLYLIEQASSMVELLYVFIVQENKSFFSFNERFELVKKGTRHLENVVVVPSGEYILSYKTFRCYFSKEQNNSNIIDASTDVEIFARYIAPYLNIRKRFAGEEPMDMVTRQYNVQMSEILPEFGIEFVEIPRKCLEQEDVVISASLVRKLMKDRDWGRIKELVPQTTYDYLVEKYAQNDNFSV